MHSSDTERKIEEVKGSLDNMRYVSRLARRVRLVLIIRLIKDVSPSAKATVRVMDFLLGVSTLAPYRGA
jgi:hypothetical protein